MDDIYKQRFKKSFYGNLDFLKMRLQELEIYLSKRCFCEYHDAFKREYDFLTDMLNIVCGG